MAGCSTGEEVYSLAISLLEYLEGRRRERAIKILATDLNEAALEKARAGVYLDNIEIDVSPTRLRRFFVRQDGHYQVSKSIRELCVFSRHNVAHDPPFSRLDLISCRNVLIYMDALASEAGDPAAALRTESRAAFSSSGRPRMWAARGVFRSVDGHNRIFSRSPTVGNCRSTSARRCTGGTSRCRRAGSMRVPLWNALDVQKEADRVLLSRYRPGRRRGRTRR